MALHCVNCGKGIAYGHAVSHAKNRTKRVFKPNLQKLKVLRDGVVVRVKLCTNCIQRMKKDGQFGIFKPIIYIKADKEIKETIAQMPKIEVPIMETVKSAKKKKEETMAIEDIVGKA